MNISKYFSNGIKSIKNNEGSLKQILILTSLAVIILGFGEKEGLNPAFEMAGPPMDFSGLDGFNTGGYAQHRYTPYDQETAGYDGQVPGPQGYTPGEFEQSERKRKHKHHRKPKEEKTLSSTSQIQYGNGESMINENSPEVPYTVE